MFPASSNPHSLSCPINRLGDYKPFDWSASDTYAAFGTVLEQAYGAPGSYGYGSSVLVIDPPNEVIYQTAGPAGGASWYLKNGTYLTSVTSEGTACLYNPLGTYEYQRRNYLNQVFRSGTIISDLLCNLDNYGGLVLDASSCQERIFFDATMDSNNWIHSMNVIFPLKQFNSSLNTYQTYVQQTIFSYGLFESSPSFAREFIAPLPAECLQPLPLCEVFYPSGPFVF